MQPQTPVTRALDDLGVAYELHIHAKPLRSLEHAAAERNLDPEQIVRSLLFRLEDGTYIVVLMPGSGKVDWPKLRHFLGVSRLTTATAAQVAEITGYETGAVSPFGLPSPLRVLADRTIMDQHRVSLGAGIRNAGVIMDRADLLRVLTPEIGDFKAGS